MSTANKLTYLNTTKQKLKQAINNIGGEVTDETTFREYVNQLENAYDNLPKTEYQEGTEVTLSNTLKGKLDYENGVVGIGQTSQKILPNEYQEVEYIKSDGNQYLDTGVQLSYNSKVEMICKIDGLVSGNTSYPFFGFRKMENGQFLNNKFALWVGTNYSVAFNFGAQDTGYISGTSLTTKTKLTMSSEGYYVNDNMTACTSTNQFENTKSATVFAIAQADAGADLLNRGVIMELYSLKIWNSTTLVRHFIPCYRISDNVIGMYDLVTGTFYTNQGTGTFTKGANAPTPNAEIPINRVTGNQDEVVSGKNIWAFTNENFFMNSNTTTEIINVSKIEVTSSNTTYANSKFLVSEQGGDVELKDGIYTFSLGKVTNSNSNMTSQLMTLSTYTNGTREPVEYISMGTPKTVNIVNAPNKKYVLEFWGSYGTALINTATYENIQIEENNQATPYEPYITPTSYQLSLGDIELNAIGNYKDYIFKNLTNNKWYLHKEVGKVTFNGTETWYIQITQDYTRVDTRDIPNLLHQASRQECYSNYFKFSSTATTHKIGDMFAYWINNGSIYLYPSADITSVDEFKQWLSTHNTSVYYIFETPTDTEITDETLINQLNNWYNAHSLNGTTIITSNGNLPMIIKVRGLKGE